MNAARGPRVPLILLVAIGSGAGSLLRVALSDWLAAGSPPWTTTTAINAVGSLLAGWLFGVSQARTGELEGRRELQALLVAGFCGGLTTFSGFGLQTSDLLAGGDFGSAALNLWFALVIAVGAAWLGRRLTSRRID